MNKKQFLNFLHYHFSTGMCLFDKHDVNLSTYLVHFVKIFINKHDCILHELHQCVDKYDIYIHKWLEWCICEKL